MARKTTAELEKMREANLFVFDVLSELIGRIEPGVSTKELDDVARNLTQSRGATPAFLGYPSSQKGVGPFPGVICASVNGAIVHGVPSDKPLCRGDIVSLDYGCAIDGFYGDSAVTVGVGEISTAARRLLEVTEASLASAIEQCVPGNRIGDISQAIQSTVEGNGFRVVKEFVGHGIGREMHEPPQVANFGRSGQGRLLRAGMVLAIEPMVTAGNGGIELAQDGWTALTKDGSLSAHFEHSVAITERGPLVLSRP